ncbi:MAG: hypothetical protein KJ990_09325 [Proteobacteria bacterium]|nr:hypothetical protein [Pseudomonadota bacterium]MBU1650160.1 hypothetical protein [Pseudomonadota bacterium]
MSTATEQVEEKATVEAVEPGTEAVELGTEAVDKAVDETKTAADEAMNKKPKKAAIEGC